MDLKEEIKNIHGESAKKSYGEILIDLLLAPSPDDAHSNKYRYYSLAVKILNKDSFEFDKEESEFVLEKLGRLASPLVYGRIKDALDADLKLREALKES